MEPTVLGRLRTRYQTEVLRAMRGREAVLGETCWAILVLVREVTSLWHLVTARASVRWIRLLEHVFVLGAPELSVSHPCSGG